MVPVGHKSHNPYNIYPAKCKYLNSFSWITNDKEILNHLLKFDHFLSFNIVPTMCPYTSEKCQIFDKLIKFVNNGNVSISVTDRKHLYLLHMMHVN